jgi:chitinase
MRRTLRLASLFTALLLAIAGIWATQIAGIPTTQAASSLSVQYLVGTGGSGTTTAQLAPYLQITNNTTASVALSQLKIRYWFTRDSAQSVVAACDWAQIGCATVTQTTAALTPAQTNADYYVEVGFTTGTLNAGSNTGEIELRIYKSDWSNFDQSNDYSFDATKTSFADWTQVTLYNGSTLVWGTAPGGATATPTPTSGGQTPTPTPTATSNPTATPTPTPTTTPNPTGNKQVVGYFTQWGIYQRAYNVKNIETSGTASKLTALNYAFSNISSDLKCAIGDSYADYDKAFTADISVDGQADTWDGQPLRGNFNQLKKLKTLHPNLKTLISIGGWTWSAHFSDAALPANRAAFVSSCIDLFIKGNLPTGTGTGAGVFDGIDIDWEYPAAPGNTGNVYRPEDTQNFTALLAEFRTQLNALSAQTGKQYLLTIAAPAGQDKYQKIELNKISSSLNWLNLMTYDMHGAWDAQGPTNFHSPLYCSPSDPSPAPANAYCANNAVNDYLAAGIPGSKIVLGVPFYGRGWTNVPNSNNGLYQSSSSMQAAPGTYEAGIEDYKVLKNLGYPSFRDSTTQAFWIFNGSTFWSYDDPTSLTTKMSYVKSKGLGGAMFWSLDGDDSSGTLASAVYNGLK